MMKKIFILITVLCSLQVAAQPGKKPAAQKQPSQADMNKMMEEAMKAEGMSKEEQEEMKKMMKDVMPALQDHNATVADYPEFSSNKELVPKKNAAMLTAFSKKALTKTEISSYATGLYTKLMSRAEAAEVALVKKIIAQTPKATDIGSAAVLVMMQGHPQAALALSIKAVMADPSSLNWQNNMAALLTSYGYAEQAMPVLKKLAADLPLNSTVMNNVGQAWLSAGQTDSAARYFSFAYRINPLHPEATLCGGLMEELTGDPVKPGDAYREALENSLNPFSEQVLKNHDKNYTAGDLDFEKIKRNIAIYEYFPKGWMDEPQALSNDVKNYNEDKAVKEGYDKMITEFKEKIELLLDGADDEINKTVEKGEKEFIKEMAAETIKGLSFMSKPATIVLGVLMTYQVKWSQEHAEELKKIAAWKQGLNLQREKNIAAIYKQISDSKRTKCEDFKKQLDGIENDYMRTVNNRLRDYLLKKTEEHRQWLNALTTWNWYVSGNTKNYVLIQDLGFTAQLAETYASIIEAMETLPEHCNPMSADIIRKIPAPEVPNFTCPAFVSIPAGPEWQQLVAAGKDFNKNNYQVKKTDNPVPNTSVAFGSSKMVAQPGLTPSVKTANGSISPTNANVEAAMDKGLMEAFRRANAKKQQVADAIDKGLSDAMKRMQERRKQGILGDDEEPVPLPKIPVDDDELVPLPKIPLDDLTPLDASLLTRYKLIKELMNKMLTADCKNVKTPKQNLKDQLDRMNKKIKELDAFETMMDEIKRLENEIAQKEADAQKREQLKKQLEDFQKATDELDKFEEMNEFLKRAEKFGKEMDAIDDKKMFKAQSDKIMQKAYELEATPAILKDLQQNGLQPSISSGLQAPGTFTTQKDLFK